MQVRTTDLRPLIKSLALTLLVACSAATSRPEPAPAPPSTPPVEEDPFAEVVASAATALERPLRLAREGERVVVYDGSERVEIAAQDAESFADALEPELALGSLQPWLGQASDVLSFSKQRSATGAHFAWVRRAGHSDYCFLRPGQDAICLVKPGRISDVRLGPWTGQPPTSLLSEYRQDNRRWVHMGYRLEPQLTRRLAAHRPMPASPLPATFGPAAEAEPRYVDLWRPVDPSEAVELGPLLHLEALSVPIAGTQLPRPERIDVSVSVARSPSRERTCVRQSDLWACSAPYARTADTFGNAMSLDDAHVALLRFREGGGIADLEFWARDRRQLTRVGSLRVGRAPLADGESETLEPEAPGEDEGSPQASPWLHAFSVPSPGCLRVHGPADPDAPPAGERISLADSPRDLRLEGAYRLQGSTLQRVARCEGQRAILASLDIPAALEPRAQVCLRELQQRVRQWPSFEVASGPHPCGAVRFRAGTIQAYDYFRYAQGQRVETMGVSRPVSDLYIHHDRLTYRGGHLTELRSTSDQYIDGQMDCPSTSWVRYRRDGRGRAVQTTSRSEHCEGVFPGTRTRRTRWRAGEGFERAHSPGDDAARYYIPTAAEPHAEVACSRTGCVCEAHMRDTTGALRLEVGEGEGYTEYQYSCEGALFSLPEEERIRFLLALPFD